MRKILSATIITVACMGTLASSAQAFDSAAFAKLIQADNPATTFGPPANPC